MAVFYRRLPRFEYLLPKTLEEALSALKNQKGSAKVFAGGTDLIPQLKRREILTPKCVIDLKGISGLDKITYDEGSGLTIGSLTTISALAQSPIVMQHFPSLFQAASSIGSPQVRNRGTFAGNICTAVPSADSAPALLTLEANVKIKGPKKRGWSLLVNSLPDPARQFSILTKYFLRYPCPNRRWRAVGYT